jgi:membrane-associated phospholipid phosphatase
MRHWQQTAWVLGGLVAFARCYFGNHWLFDSMAGVVQGYVSTQTLAHMLGGARGHDVALLSAAIVAYFVSGVIQAKVLPVPRLPTRQSAE